MKRPKALNELVMNDNVCLKGMADQRLSSRDGSNLSEANVKYARLGGRKNEWQELEKTEVINKKLED